MVFFLSYLILEVTKDDLECVVFCYENVTNHISQNPTDIYLFKFNNGNTRIICKTCSNLILKFGVFIANFYQNSHIVLEVLLLILNK